MDDQQIDAMVYGILRVKLITDPKPANATMVCLYDPEFADRTARIVKRAIELDDADRESGRQYAGRAPLLRETLAALHDGESVPLRTVRGRVQVVAVRAKGQCHATLRAAGLQYQSS